MYQTLLLFSQQTFTGRRTAAWTNLVTRIVQSVWKSRMSSTRIDDFDYTEIKYYMSVGTPSRQAVLSLYHNMLRTSQSFSSYNFREYYVRRTKETFRKMQVRSFFITLCTNLLKLFLLFVSLSPEHWTNQNESDPERLRSMYSEVVKESAVLRRSAVVNQLYGGWKLAVEAKQLEERPEAIKTRGDTWLHCSWFCDLGAGWLIAMMKDLDELGCYVS
jgi:hypothetical protein